MKDITKMTLNEMLDAGMSVGDIMKSYNDIAATKAKEQEAKKAAEAAEKARQEEVLAARRQYKKAHAKYMKAITGEDMTAEDMAEFENNVCLPMENIWKMQYAPKRIKIKAEDLDDLAAVIMNALGYK
jgi:hypothetical protein